MLYFVVTLQNGDTALMRAAEEDHVNASRVLLEHGADANFQNEVFIKLYK